MKSSTWCLFHYWRSGNKVGYYHRICHSE